MKQNLALKAHRIVSNDRKAIEARKQELKSRSLAQKIEQTKIEIRFQVEEEMKAKTIIISGTVLIGVAIVTGFGALALLAFVAIAYINR